MGRGASSARCPCFSSHSRGHGLLGGDCPRSGLGPSTSGGVSGPLPLAIVVVCLRATPYPADNLVLSGERPAYGDLQNRFQGRVGQPPIRAGEGGWRGGPSPWRAWALSLGGRRSPNDRLGMPWGGQARRAAGRAGGMPAVRPGGSPGRPVTLRHNSRVRARDRATGRPAQQVGDSRSEDQGGPVTQT